MQVSTDADVIIIGGGIVGFSIAHFLAPHRNVILLEAEERPGYHATGRSAAVVVQAYEGRVVRELTRISKAYLLAEQARLAEHALLKPRGQLVIADAAQAAAMERQFADSADLVGVASLIGAEEALKLCPILRAEAAHRALWEPGALDLDVDSLLQAFVRGARGFGATITTSARVQAMANVDGQWVVSWKNAHARAPVVVNAAGAWAAEIAVLAGAQRLPISPYLRTALLVDAPAGQASAEWPFVITHQEDVYFKPDAGKLMVSLADERPIEPCDAWADDLDVALAVDRLQRIADIEVNRVSHSWAGLRTFAPDRVPVIGWDGVAPGFCWAAGMGGFGVQTSPAIGAAVASLITQGEIPGLPVAQGLLAQVAPGRLA